MYRAGGTWIFCSHRRTRSRQAAAVRAGLRQRSREAGFDRLRLRRPPSGANGLMIVGALPVILFP